MVVIISRIVTAARKYFWLYTVARETEAKYVKAELCSDQRDIPRCITSLVPRPFQYAPQILAVGTNGLGTRLLRHPHVAQLHVVIIAIANIPGKSRLVTLLVGKNCAA